MVRAARSEMTTSGGDQIHATDPEMPPLADAQTILDAILSNGQSKIFLVDVAADGLFTYAPITAERRRRARGPRGGLTGRTPLGGLGAVDGAARTASYRHRTAR